MRRAMSIFRSTGERSYDAEILGPLDSWRREAEQRVFAGEDPWLSANLAQQKAEAYLACIKRSQPAAPDRTALSEAISACSREINTD